MNEENKKSPHGMARARTKRTGRSKSLALSRPIMFAMAVILAIAVFLFWPRGGSTPTGIGERISVVTADSGLENNSLSSEPRSGDVNIENETSRLVPERVGGSPSAESAGVKTTEATASSGANDETTVGKPSADSRSATGPDATGADMAKSVTTDKTPSKPATRIETPTTTPTPSEPVTSGATSLETAPRSAQKKSTPTAMPRLQPSDQGSWAVQLGAYGKEENAQKVIDNLSAQGYRAHIRTINTSGGEILYKVWIGYFKNREEAATYAREHHQQIGEAIPVHR